MDGHAQGIRAEYAFTKRNIQVTGAVPATVSDAQTEGRTAVSLSIEDGKAYGEVKFQKSREPGDLSDGRCHNLRE